MRIFHNVTEADRRLWKAPLVSQLFPFLWAEPHHADVSLFCDSRLWQNDHSTSRSRITAWVARFLVGKVMAYSPRGSLYHKRICLLYSVFKEHSAIQPIKINNSLTNFYRMINEAVGKGIYQLRLYVLHHYNFKIHQHIKQCCLNSIF